MKEMVLVSQILGYFLGTTFVFWMFYFGYQSYVNNKMISEIRKLQSRISVLKLMLKARLKKSCNALPGLCKGESTLVSMLQEKYGKLFSLEYTDADHFVLLVKTFKDISIEFNQYFAKKYVTIAHAQADLKTENKAEINMSPETQALEKLVEFEFAALYMAKEIIQNNEKCRLLIEYFNGLQKNKKDHLKVCIEFKIENQDDLFRILDREYAKSKMEKAAPAVALNSDTKNEPFAA